MKWILCIILSICALTINLYAQGNVQWHNGLSFNSGNSRDIWDYRNSDLAFGKYYRVLEFDHILTVEEKQNLEMDGIGILEYIPTSHYLVSINPTQLHTRNKYEGLIASFELTRNYKLSKQLLFGNPCMREGNKSLVVVKYMKGIKVADIQEILAQQNIITNRIYSYDPIFYVKVDNQQLDWLANSAWVQFVDCESAPGTPDDREGRSLHRVNMIASNPKENIHVTGKGVKVMVRDDGFVGPHIDFQGRIHQDLPNDNGLNTHGDGVSGILTGAGNYDPLIEGMAPGADLYVINYQPDFLDKTLDYHINEGVVITNTSYSDGCNLGYTINTQVVDKQIFENPELIHVFSAGNSNGADCGYGAGNQWGNVTGGHKIAKNALTTANLKIDGTIDITSSRGPTKDGRLKPEISARGTNELSTDPGNGTQVFGGTSAASPGVAGVCALLYEAYKNFHNGQNPESALIKAVIMNTATDIGTPGPDYVFGFGVIDAYRAYRMIAENRFQKHSIQNGEVQEYQIEIPGGSPLAKFMIYWAEPEASLMASKALINNLDMEVIDPSGTVHKPWVLDPTPNPLTLAQGAGLGIDTLNNFEQVSISLPVAGKYKIRVKGSFLPSNNVDFYVLNEAEDKFLRLSFPVGGEKFNITESTQVQYTSYGTDSIYIFFSADAGRNWQSFGTEASGTRLHNIQIPNIISSDSCLIEIQQGNLKDRSGYFTITSGVQGFKISKFCPGKIELSWRRSGKDSFQIYQLGEKYMDPIAVTADTTITLPDSDPRIKKWFSIAGYIKTALSEREFAIPTPDTLIACNFTKDLALKNSELNPTELYSCGALHLNPTLKVVNRTHFVQSGFTIKTFNKNILLQENYINDVNPFDSIEVAFNQNIIIDTYGIQTLTVWIEFNQDENPFNDTIFIPLNVIELPDKTGSYPMIENFNANNIPSEWIQRNDQADSKWNLLTVKDKLGVDGHALMFANQNANYFSFPIDLVSRTADLSNAIQPYLYFDLALHHFDTNIYLDSFKVRVKQVCGSGYKESILLSGISSELNTVDPTTNQNWLPEDTSWFWMAYDLSQFKGSKIVVEFEIARGIGDRTFLDNVQVREKIAGTENADITISPNPGCYNKTITFKDSTTINGKEYFWDVGLMGNPRYFYDKGPFTSKYTSVGTKRIVLKIKSDLNNDAIIIKELKIGNTASVNYNYTYVSGFTFQFHNTSVNADTYLWDFGDGTFSTEINPQHTFDSSKIYRVKLTITSPCGTYTRSINLDLTNIVADENLTADAILNIYPNPTVNGVFLNSKEQILSYRLFDMEGKLIVQNSKLNSNQTEISLNELIDGIYTLNIITRNHQFTRKIEKRQ